MAHRKAISEYGRSSEGLNRHGKMEKSTGNFFRKESQTGGKISTTRKCKNIRDKIYDRNQSPSKVFRRSVLDAVSPESTVLDIGCGREASFLRTISPSVKKAYGVDLDISETQLEGNIHLLPGDAEDIPLPDHSVDVITMTNVTEHLLNPERVFRGCNRILKPGGSLFVTAPNKFYPPVFVGRAIPHKFRQWANQIITETKRHDTFPAYYKANSRKVLHRLGSNTGLHVADIAYVSKHPEYFMFSTTAYRLAVVVERHVLQRTAFQSLRQLIFCRFVKPGKSGDI